ncbi:MAG: BlaI/MecI/CopY family transcriptional regulator [Saprospiraceae bacterium]|nr:BlaI/MecI/CopY family transcriptional regulator [Saprospiraceae bacterium]
MGQKIKPTDAELRILQVLWEHGPCSVRFVNEAISEEKEVGYTTTLKLMQIMAEKGIATRDTSSRKHLYEAAVPRSETQHHLLQKLADLAFNGSSVRLAMRALGEERISKGEINELRQLLDEMEESASDD